MTGRRDKTPSITEGGASWKGRWDRRDSATGVGRGG